VRACRESLYAVLRAPTTVALVEWAWGGHHPTYFTHFAAALAEAGSIVVPFCPNPQDFSERLEALQLNDSVARRIGKAECLPAPAKWTRLLPHIVRAKVHALVFFGRIAARLRAWDRRASAKIDLVFFTCVYDQTFREFPSVERLFGYSWAGLYLHVRSFRMPGSPVPYIGGLPCPEKIFTCKKLRAVAVLDEGAVAPLKKITGGKPIVVFPDLTCNEMPSSDTSGWGLADKAETLARGRPIVLLAGHLRWTKGLEDFTALALLPEMQDAFFLLAGDVSWAEVPEEKVKMLQRAWEEAPNIYAHLQRLPEATMNTLICRASVVFAAYRSFPNSSNVLTKVAEFERPIVVSDGFLMAERVREFGLGEIVAEGDVSGLSQALRLMAAPDYFGQLKKRARWAEYRSMHSAERLPASFNHILESLKG
jgi:glycosyltransferase involved in cell wall biosynthesis